MKPARIAALALCLLALVVFMAGRADAAASNNCAADTTGSGTTLVQGAIVTSGGLLSCGTGSNEAPVNAGAQFSLFCEQQTAVLGIAPNVMTIRLYDDNAGFGTFTGAFATTNANTCIAHTSPVTYNFWCTSDGTATGSPRYGFVRIQLEMQQTGVGAYDLNSDANQWGAVRCNPVVTIAESNPQTTYVGGDTVGASYSTDAAPYDTTNSGNPHVVCGPTDNTLTADFITTSTRSQTTTVIGSPSAWQTGCALSFQFQETLKSSISGFTTKARFTFRAGTGVTVTNDANGQATIATLTATKTLDRTLTDSEPCASVTPLVVNRGDSETVSCKPWKDARGNNVPNNQPGRAWYNRAAQYRATADFPSLDNLFGAQGDLPSTIAATTSATATTGKAYHKAVEEFSTTARTDAVLLNWGNSTGQFDVSATWTFGGINMTKCAAGTPTCQNATGFTISADNEYAQAKGLRDVNGNLKSGIAITCQRTLPTTVLETAVGMGNTDASGNSPVVQFAVLTPAGTWTMTCTATANGNTATYAVRFFHSSAFSANIAVAVQWNVTTFIPDNGTAAVNVTSCLREYDQASDSVLRIFPDDAPKLTVEAYNPATDLHDHVLFDRFVMQNEDTVSTATCYRALVYADEQWLRNGAIAYTTTNFTGSPFIGFAGYQLATNQTGNMTGNFTGGSIRGQVFDTSTVPQDMSVTTLIVAVYAASVLVAYASDKSLWPTFLGVVLALFGGLLTLEANGMGVLTTGLGLAPLLMVGAGCILVDVLRLNKLGWSLGFKRGDDDEQGLEL